MIDHSRNSPEEYFVILLSWLKEQKVNDSCSAYNILIKKRPDLNKIILTKHNELTLVPHIDFAVEILEENIKPDSNRVYEGSPRLNEKVYKVLLDNGYKNYKCYQMHSIVDCDECRKMRRDSLTAYLVGSGKFASVNEIHGELLIDVEMEPTILTTRINVCISTVQLFINRCFLNLEAVVLSEDAYKEWVHLKDYQTWEVYHRQ